MVKPGDLCSLLVDLVADEPASNNAAVRPGFLTVERDLGITWYFWTCESPHLTTALACPSETMLT